MPNRLTSLSGEAQSHQIRILEQTNPKPASLTNKLSRQMLDSNYKAEMQKAKVICSIKGSNSYH